jgi:hypothetical protein
MNVHAPRSMRSSLYFYAVSPAAWSDGRPRSRGRPSDGHEGFGLGRTPVEFLVCLGSYLLGSGSHLKTGWVPAPPPPPPPTTQNPPPPPHKSPRHGCPLIALHSLGVFGTG